METFIETLIEIAQGADPVRGCDPQKIFEASKAYSDHENGPEAWEARALINVVGTAFVWLLRKPADLERSIAFGEALKAANQPKRAYVIHLNKYLKG